MKPLQAMAVKPGNYVYPATEMQEAIRDVRSIILAIRGEYVRSAHNPGKPPTCAEAYDSISRIYKTVESLTE